jgi:hypothetical protein
MLEEPVVLGRRTAARRRVTSTERDGPAALESISATPVSSSGSSAASDTSAPSVAPVTSTIHGPRTLSRTSFPARSGTQLDLPAPAGPAELAGRAGVEEPLDTGAARGSPTVRMETPGRASDSRRRQRRAWPRRGQPSSREARPDPHAPGAGRRRGERDHEADTGPSRHAPPRPSRVADPRSPC